jgi:hypothetical protein
MAAPVLEIMDGSSHVMIQDNADSKAATVDFPTVERSFIFATTFTPSLGHTNFMYNEYHWLFSR